jgi:hypothetical protein
MSDVTVGGRRWIGPRTKIALGIAFVEGLIVWVGDDVSRWTVFAVALPLIAVYFAWGRNSKRPVIRKITWIAATSQALALVLVILAVILSWLALALAVVLAVVALLFLFADRGGRR